MPAILVSPWVGARVEKTVFDHASLLKYLTEKWKLGPLGRRTEVAKSIGIAFNQDKPRAGTVPFIRVPYSELIPERPDLEKEDSSNHQEALHAFAAYLAEERDSATAKLIQELARGGSFWVRSKATLGKLMIRVGNILTKDLEKLRRKRIITTTEVAMRRLRQARPPEPRF